MVSAAALVLRCQLIGGFAGNEIVDPGAGAQAGATNATGGDGGSGGGECPLQRAPAKVDTPSGGDEITFTLAARSVDLGEASNKLLGLDLDEACTCGDEACACASVPTCARPPVVASDAVWQRCDDEAGVDANSKQLFKILQGFDTVLSSDLVSAGINGGAGTVLLDVRQYNGLADDDQVLVGAYTSGAFQTAACNDGPPAWEGEDAWPIDRGSSLIELAACGETPSPAVFDAFAYVTDHQLVAHLRQVTLAIEVAGLVLQLTLRDATVVVPLERRDSDGRWHTTGATLAGHWPLGDVFRALGEINGLTPADLCEADLTSIQSSVCAAADVAVDPHDEGQPCDAVSFALEFSAEEAKFGNTVDLPSSTACSELLALDCETTTR